MKNGNGNKISLDFPNGSFLLSPDNITILNRNKNIAKLSLAFFNLLILFTVGHSNDP